MQATETVINACLTYVLPEGGVLTLEMLRRSGQKKRTLGQFLTELRKRVDIDEHFDMILEEFLDKRNTLIHRVDNVPGWSLDNEQGCQIVYQFVNRLMDGGRVGARHAYSITGSMAKRRRYKNTSGPYAW
jgi:hypothetical protein